MTNLYKILTVVLFFSSSISFANKCEEVELGGIGKSHWGDSIGNGLRGELVNQLQKNDDLFEKLVPEIEFDINPTVKMSLNFSRSVKNNLPEPKSGKISKTDFFTLQVNNKIQVEFEAKSEGPYLFSEGNAGLHITHSTQKFPGKEESGCDIFKKIIDRSTVKGNMFYSAACVSRDKNLFSKYYEKTISFFSKGVKWIFDFFVSTERNIEFAKDPLAALKIHSTLGVPMDYNIFLENNSDIAFGDIVEHTSFFGVTPVGVKIDFFEFLRPSHSAYRRFFRTLAFKKVIGNKVIVEIEDTVITGQSTEIFKIKPRILGIFKLNMGRWNRDGFKQENVVQRFEVNLNKKNGKKFFKKILYSAYFPSVKLNKNSILIDHTDYLDSVVAKSPVYKDGKGVDRKITLKIPGVIDFENRAYEKVDNIIFEGNEYTNGEKFRRNKTESKIGFNFKLLKLNKVEKNFECQMKLSSNFTLAVDDDSSMNIDCSYSNEYATELQSKNIADYLNMILNGKLSSEDSETLRSVVYPKADDIDMFSNLSFSKKQIKKILKYSEDDIYAEISRLFFGESSANVLAPRYHSKWRKAKPGIGARGSNRRARVNSRKYLNCASLFQTVGITKEYNKEYEKFNGLVGRGKGIDPYTRKRCYSYFEMANKVVRSITDLQKSVENSGRLNQVLNLLVSLDQVGYAQSVLTRLAGGPSEDGLRFTYIVSSPYFKDSFIAKTNGRKYEVEPKNIRKSLSTQFEPENHPRIEKVKYTYNTCQKDLLMATFKLNYPVENINDIAANFVLREYGVIGNDNVFDGSIKLDRFIRNTENEFIASIKLNAEINENIAHNMYLQLNNENDFRLSREVEIYLKKIDTLVTNEDDQ